MTRCIIDLTCLINGTTMPVSPQNTCGFFTAIQPTIASNMCRSAEPSHASKLSCLKDLPLTTSHTENFSLYIVRKIAHDFATELHVMACNVGLDKSNST